MSNTVSCIVQHIDYKSKREKFAIRKSKSTSHEDVVRGETILANKMVQARRRVLRIASMVQLALYVEQRGLCSVE